MSDPQFHSASKSFVSQHAVTDVNVSLESLLSVPVLLQAMSSFQKSTTEIAKRS